MKTCSSRQGLSGRCRFGQRTSRKRTFVTRPTDALILRPRQREPAAQRPTLRATISQRRWPQLLRLPQWRIREELCRKQQGLARVGWALAASVVRGMTGDTAPDRNGGNGSAPRRLGQLVLQCGDASIASSCGSRRGRWIPRYPQRTRRRLLRNTRAKIWCKGSRLMLGLNSPPWPGCVRSPAGEAAPQRLNISCRRCPSGSLKKMLRLLPGRSLTATPRLSSSAFKLS